MSDNTWLILDVSYLSHRAAHSTGKLSLQSGDGKSLATGVMFGVFRDIQTFQKQHNTKKIVFCFDHKHNHRYDILPTYKETRKKKREEASEEERQAFSEMHRQIVCMRKEYLPEMGFKNVYSIKGYEADDLIASCCLNLPNGDSAIIVGSDKDLYQLLSHRVSLWNPFKKEMVTRETFKQTYGIGPKKWKDVKAIAGCSGDDVPGVYGVGELTACKYLTGELTKGKKFDAIEKGWGLWQKNLDLVSLPYEGCPNIELVDDDFTTDKWNKVVKKLGMKSLMILDSKSKFGFAELSL